jgi:hypothetical protein
VIVTFGTYTAADLALTPLNPPVTFAPAADAYFDQAAPATNNGATSTIRAMNVAGGSQTSYLRFNVAGLNRAVQSATLRLYVTNASNQGGAIYSTSNNYQASTMPWTESGLNWNNASAIGGTPLSSLGSVAINTWVEFDVTAAFTGNGVYNFGLQTSSSNDVRYSSKEGTASNRPQLVIQQSDRALPAISGFSPASGLPGAEVTLNGTGFVGITSVRFNGVAAANFTVDSDTKIRVIVPVGAASGKLSLTVAGGSSLSEDTFGILVPPAPPLIDAFSPASGAAGTAVTIKGAGLGGATAVAVNGAPASSFTIDSDAQIRAIVPAGATSGKLSVTAAGGSATSVASFVVSSDVPAPPPTYRVYISLITGGAAAAKHAYTAQATGWSTSATARWYFCELEGRTQ